MQFVSRCVMTLITITGIAASIFTACSLVPQLVKLLKEKKGNDISIAMLAVLFTGLALWVYYGVLKDDWIIILSNAFSLAINATTTFFTIRYKNR